MVSLNTEVFPVDLGDDVFLVYSPLRRTAFVANVDFVNAIARVDGPEPDAEVVGFLRQIGLIGNAPDILPITKFLGDPQPTSVTLFLTTACQLRCSYCYASAGDKPARNMSMEVAQNAIDFAIQNAVAKSVDCIELGFHGGGEATTNWKVLTGAMTYACSQASRNGLRVRAFAATNGVLSDTQIDWIAANLNGVSVSFDGLPEVHDQHRFTVLGQNSSHRVMHTLRRFDSTGFAYGIRMTVTADQIPRLPDSVAFICDRFHPKRIQVEPAYQLGRWSEAPSAETEAFISAFRLADEAARDRGFSLFFSAARATVLSNHFCGLSQDLFAVTPDGGVSGCFEVFAESDPKASVFFYGNASGDGGYRFELPVLNNLRRQAVQHREFCSGCFAKWNCSGDCYHKSVALGQSEFAGSDRCHITRELTKDALLRNVHDSGGLIWRGASADADSTSPASKEYFFEELGSITKGGQSYDQ